MKKSFLPPTARLCFTGALFSFLLAGCWGYKKEVNPPGPDGAYSEIKAEAYVPVYGKDTLLRGIYAMQAQPILKAGKIYVYGHLLFQVESEKGIHVIDYSDPKNPVKMGFIRCKGSSELAIKNGYLITNNLNDLVTIDIHQPDNVKEVARIANAFPHYYAYQYLNNRPADREKYYVCPDISKGDVIDWKLEKNVRDAYCH